MDGRSQPGPGNGGGQGGHDGEVRGPGTGTGSPGTMGRPPQPLCLSALRVSFPGLLAPSPPLPPGPQPPHREGALLHSHTLSQTHTSGLKTPTSHTIPPPNTDSCIPDTHSIEDTNAGHTLMSLQAQSHKHTATDTDVTGPECLSSAVAPTCRPARHAARLGQDLQGR